MSFWPLSYVGFRPYKRVLLLLLVFYLPVAYGGELEERRLTLSLSIFPKIVAVDKGLGSKLTKDSRINFLFLYDKSEVKARELAKLLKKKVPNLRGWKVDVTVENVRNISLIFPERAAAIFITERFSDINIEKIIRAGISEQITVFSPFAGDVERGVTVGIDIGHRIMPYFNLNTLRASRVEVNEKLLKLSKRYE